jgi:hypothetical protein
MIPLQNCRLSLQYRGTLFRFPQSDEPLSKGGMPVRLRDLKNIPCNLSCANLFPVLVDYIDKNASKPKRRNPRRHCAKEIPMAISSISGTVYTSSAESQTSWTKQQVAQLKALVNQDLPIDEIAQRLKRSPAAIKFEAATLGLSLDTK